MWRKRFHVFRMLVGIAVALSLVVGLAPQVRAQINRKPETPGEIKAYFLYNFAKLTVWPKEAMPGENEPLVLGILGKDPFGKDIDIITGKTVHNRKLVVKYCSNVEEAKVCHCLFISSSEANNFQQTLKALENTSILTIAEIEGFIQQSGIINLVAKQKTASSQTVGFEINLAAAVKANLKLDTQLLKMADKVKS